YRARAEQFSRKELDDVGAALHGAEHFLDGHRSGDTRYLVTVAEPHRRLVQRRSHDVLRAGQHRHPGSLRIEYGAGPENELAPGEAPRKLPNGLLGAVNGKGNLDGGDTPFVAGFRELDCLIR